MKKITLYFLVFMIALLSLCKKEKFDLNKIQTDILNQNLAIPIGEVEMKISDFEDKFKDGHFQLNSNTGLLEYLYKKQLLEVGINDLIKQMNQNFTESLIFDATKLAAFNSASVGQSITFTSNFTKNILFQNSAELDSITLDKMTLRFTLNTSFQHSIINTIILPNMKINGQSVTIKLDTIDNLNNLDTSITLNNVKIDLTQGGTTFNTFSVIYSTKAIKKNNPVSNTESIVSNINMKLEEFNNAYGYFGVKSFTAVNSQSLINMFSNFNGGTIHIENPRIEIITENEIGADIGLNFNYIRLLNNSTYKYITGAGIDSIKDILPANYLGDKIVQVNTINDSNIDPDLSDLINMEPDGIEYTGVAKLNELNITKIHTNFITKDTKFRLYGKLILPLHGYVNNLVLEDTTDAEIEKIVGLKEEDLKYFKQLQVRIIVDNGLPLDCFTQIYFADDGNNIIDSIYSDSGNYLMKSAEVGFNLDENDENYGKIISPTRTITDIYMDKIRYLKLIKLKSKKIIYKAIFNTASSNVPKNIIIEYKNSLNIKISAKLETNLYYNYQEDSTNLIN